MLDGVVGGEEDVLLKEARKRSEGMRSLEFGMMVQEAVLERFSPRKMV